MNKTMNRQLKFRIWDKTEKCWENPSHMEVCRDDNNIWVGTLMCLFDYKNQDRWVIQQYTGLKDKNSKEIYEGDRVRFGYTGKVDIFGEVIWLEDRASFGVRTKNAFETFEDLMDYMKYFEVVGNIFQLPCNPDHNGECLVCDCWLSDCQFLNKENKD